MIVRKVSGSLGSLGSIKEEEGKLVSIGKDSNASVAEIEEKVDGLGIGSGIGGGSLVTMGSIEGRGSQGLVDEEMAAKVDRASVEKEVGVALNNGDQLDQLESIKEAMLGEVPVVSVSIKTKSLPVSTGSSPERKSQSPTRKFSESIKGAMSRVWNH